MSSHKRLSPQSNCHLEQLMFVENLPRKSEGTSVSDSQILIYYFGSSLFLMITGKVKIGIEKFKGSKRTYLHMSSTALQSKNTSPKMEQASIWETFRMSPSRTRLIIVPGLVHVLLLVGTSHHNASVGADLNLEAPFLGE